MWESLLTFEKLKRNLVLNRLLTSRQALQVEVHYGFLSAFTHSTKRANELAYPRRVIGPARGPDHYSSELVLLYVTTIAAEELVTFARMAKRTPRLRLARWEAVAQEIQEARRATDYFWFLSGRAQTFDRVNEVHTRIARRRQFTAGPFIDPMGIAEDRVRYYTNPLVRLVELHRSSREMSTGLISPALFQREDATYRI